MKKLIRFLILLLLSGSFMAEARGALADLLPTGFQRLTFTVAGVTREALVYAPVSAKTESVPVVFVFHGHGGTARQVMRSFALNDYWPEAISVYMQGLNTPGQLTDPQGKKPGWQAASGDHGDRDLKFFDAVLARLKLDYRVDARRIYATGHSNGGGFTYLLWATRGEVFAAVAPSAAVAKYVKQLAPKPALLLAGENDPLVKFAWQKRMMTAVRQLNDCETAGKPWAPQCTLYPSKTNAPVVTYIHPGGHEFAPDAPKLIVKFFREHPTVE